MEEKEKIKGVGIESMEDIRAVDIAEYIYKLISMHEDGEIKMEEIKEKLGNMIVEMKEHIFDKIEHLFDVREE
mgnify:CR=1 FL=1